MGKRLVLLLRGKKAPFEGGKRLKFLHLGLRGGAAGAMDMHEHTNTHTQDLAANIEEAGAIATIAPQRLFHRALGAFEIQRCFQRILKRQRPSTFAIYNAAVEQTFENVCLFRGVSSMPPMRLACGVSLTNWVILRCSTGRSSDACSQQEGVTYKA